MQEQELYKTNTIAKARRGEARPRPTPSSARVRVRREGRRFSWVLRDVVFQDVGFQNASCSPLTHTSFRCEQLQFSRVDRLLLPNPTSSNATSPNSRLSLLGGGVCIYIYIYICLCLYVYIYVYTIYTCTYILNIYILYIYVNISISYNMHVHVHRHRAPRGGAAVSLSNYS